MRYVPRAQTDASLEELQARDLATLTDGELRLTGRGVELQRRLADITCDVVDGLVPVPAQKRRASDEEDHPTVPGQQPGQRAEHESVGGRVVGPGDLTTNHPQLVSQDGDLHVLHVRGQPHQAQKAPDDHETQGAYHHDLIFPSGIVPGSQSCP